MYSEPANFRVDNDYPETRAQTTRLCALMLEQPGLNFRVYISAAFREFAGAVDGKTAYRRTRTWFWSKSPLLGVRTPRR